ncbi:hypothetical protein M2388_000750 [Leucobacter aridicollis]|nr:hypothetical protein [Leucobacter aridicollis]
MPSNTAFSLVKTLLHELVHLYCDRTGVRDVVSRSQEHTAAYARVASRAGLEVKHLPHTTVKYYTPDLTFEARLRLQHIAAALRAAWPEMHSLRSLHAQGSIFSSSTSPNTPKGHDSHVF